MKKLIPVFFFLFTLTSCSTPKNDNEILALAVQEASDNSCMKDLNNEFLYKKIAELSQKSKGNLTLKINDKPQTINIKKIDDHSFVFKGKSLPKSFTLNFNPENKTFVIDGYEKIDCTEGCKTTEIYKPTKQSITEYNMNCGLETIRDRELLSKNINSPKINIIFENSKIHNFTVYYPMSTLLKGDHKGHVIYELDFKDL